MATVDKAQALKEIEDKEHSDMKILEYSGILCSGCGSSQTVSRSRYAIESSKNETWGNKDHESGLHTVECLNCGCIAGN